jgi:hypothetical protein
MFKIVNKILAKTTVLFLPFGLFRVSVKQWLLLYTIVFGYV